MPRKQNNLLKYKCLELCCFKLVRQDKWNEHCKKDHGYKAKRGETIKKEVVAYKDDDGKWQPSNGEAGAIRKFGAESTDSCSSTNTTDFTWSASVSNADFSLQAKTEDKEELTQSQMEISCNAEGEILLEAQQNMSPSRLVMASYADDQSNKVTDQLIPSEDDAGSENILNVTDPASFCGRRLRAEDINLCLNAGPCQPEYGYMYPSINGRRFNSDWFNTEMPDKTSYRRLWLTYSVSKDKAYCLPCVVFSGHSGSDTWTSTGFCDWGNGLRDIKRHESSKEHRQSEVSQIQWKRGIRIDYLMEHNRTALIEENRKVVECAIDCLKFLATEMIALWGASSMEGKFMSLFRCLARRDASAAAYLAQIDDARQETRRMNRNLISYRNITKLLTTMKQMIIEQIILTIKTQKKVCIIFDSTQDSSKREASVVLVRYLDSGTIAEPVINERLLEVFTTGESTGSVLKEHLVNTLNEVGLEMSWIVGQCYDGAGNMRGCYSVLATQIQKDNGKAVYIWCHAHRLNLVMNAVTSCCADIRNTLGILEELYVFMNGHKRNDVFLKAQGDIGHKMQVKRVSTTRWNSTEAAVDTVLLKKKKVPTATLR